MAMVRQRISVRGRGERGSAIMEFALCAPFLALVFGIALTVGFSANRLTTVSALTRNVLRLVIQGVDLSAGSPQGLENQKLVSKMARGLGLGTSSTNFTPDPAGKALVILSKVIRVDRPQCAQGITGWNGDVATCPNYNLYVLQYRVTMGNAGRWTSKIGNPTTAPDTDGTYTDAQVASNSGIRVGNFASILTLNLGKEAYMVEVYADNSDFNFFKARTPVPHVYSRYVS